MSKSWGKGSTGRWRKIRARVLALNQEQNGGRCQLQLPGCTGQAEQVHHVLGRAVTGDDPRHLMAVCQHCNGRAGDPTRIAPAPKRISSW